MIYKFEPFSTSKELGKEYNAHCEMVPRDEDWILIRDYDTMFLVPETFQVVEKAIENYPDTAIFGAMCNRIGLKHHRLEDVMPENDSVRMHMKIARAMAEEFKDGQCKPVSYVAGFFMLFRKAYWKLNPFQKTIVHPTTGNLFDITFSKTARNRKMPLRVIKGAYLWHTYRIEKDWRDKTHLK